MAGKHLFERETVGGNGHDNSPKTLEHVAAHDNLFFTFTSDPDGPGPIPPLLSLTPQDQADIGAYMKLLR